MNTLHQLQEVREKLEDAIGLLIDTLNEDMEIPERIYTQGTAYLIPNLESNLEELDRLITDLELYDPGAHYDQDGIPEDDHDMESW